MGPLRRALMLVVPAALVSTALAAEPTVLVLLANASDDAGAMARRVVAKLDWPNFECIVVINNTPEANLWRPIEEHQPFYIKLTAGALHGYSGQYQGKIPLNSSGVAPAIIPSVGYCVGRYCGEFALLGLNAALLTIGMTIP